MWEHLSVTPMQALVVVASTAGMYCVFIVFVRVLGQRALARMTSTDLATIVALGAVIGRASLGNFPTLGGGLVALGTLFGMQALAGQLQRWSRSGRLLNNRPVLLMAGAEVLGENLKKAHLVEQELWPKLRLAGIRNPSEVACVILEPTGEISVLRRGAELNRRMMADIRGIEHLDESLFREPERG